VGDFKGGTHKTRALGNQERLQKLQEATGKTGKEEAREEDHNKLDQSSKVA